MATSNMDAFGAYKNRYSMLTNREELDPKSEVVWISKRCEPNDLRLEAPVPRYKLVTPKHFPPPEEHWIPPGDPHPRSYVRNDTAIYATSFSTTRCEDWSSLKEMLPSKGSVERAYPPNWGTAPTRTPLKIPRPPTRFPIINSPMSRYVSEMHLIDRKTRLY